MHPLINAIGISAAHPLVTISDANIAGKSAWLSETKLILMN